MVESDTDAIRVGNWHTYDSVHKINEHPRELINTSDFLSIGHLLVSHLMIILNGSAEKQENYSHYGGYTRYPDTRLRPLRRRALRSF